MPNPFVKALAEKLDRSTEVTEKQLQKLAGELSQRLRENGALTIPDLGTLRLEQDQIVFQPASSLERAVNNRLSGLEPMRVPDSGYDASHEKDDDPAMADDSPTPPSESGSLSDEPRQDKGLSELMDRLSRKKSEEEASENDVHEDEQEETFSASSTEEPPSSDTWTASKEAEHKHPEADQPLSSSDDLVGSSQEDEPHTLNDTFASDQDADDESSPLPSTASTDRDKARSTDKPSLPDDSPDPVEASKDEELSHSEEGDATNTPPEESGRETELESSSSLSSEKEEEEEGLSSLESRSSATEHQAKPPFQDDDAEETHTAPHNEEDVESEYAAAGAATPSSVGPDRAPEPDPTPKAVPEPDNQKATNPNKSPDEAKQPSSEESRDHTSAASRRARYRQQRRNGNSNSALFWVSLLLILALLGAGAWLLFQSSGSLSTPTPQKKKPTSTKNEQLPSPQETIANSSLATYRLPSTISAEQGGWTLILASETSRPAAKRSLRRYAEWLKGGGLPLGIIKGTSGGVTRYRVGIGQFSSQSELQEAKSRLQVRLPDDAWPLDLSSTS